MGKASISVVIPVRNGESTIRECIRSAVSQTLSPTEIIVVDDGSSDDTTKIVAEFGSVVKLIPGPQAGAGPARNAGVAIANGDLIAFLDADDVWHPEKLEHQVALAEGDVIVGTYADYVAGPKKKYVGSSIRTRDDDEAIKLLRDASGMPALLSTWVIPKSLIAGCEGFDASYIYAQDFELAVRLACRGVGFKVVRKPLVTYLLHGESETARSYVEQYLTASYVSARTTGKPEISLESWLEKNQKLTKLRLYAIAGFHFRRALILFGNSNYFSAARNLVFATILNPKAAALKLLRQAPRILRKP